MRSAARIVFSLCYLTMTVGFTFSTCTCWDPSDSTDLTSNALVGSSCCCGGDSSQPCCVKKAGTVQLIDDQATAETWTPAGQKHISAFSQVDYSSFTNDVARFYSHNTGPPQRNAPIPILGCSLLL